MTALANNVNLGRHHETPSTISLIRGKSSFARMHFRSDNERVVVIRSHIVPSFLSDGGTNLHHPGYSIHLRVSENHLRLTRSTSISMQTLATCECSACSTNNSVAYALNAGRCIHSNHTLCLRNSAEYTA